MRRVQDWKLVGKKTLSTDIPESHVAQQDRNPFARKQSRQSNAHFSIQNYNKKTVEFFLHDSF